MDTGRGHLEEIPKDIFEKARQWKPKASGVFRVGEIVELHGARFKVNKVTPKYVKLRILPSEPR